jgi:hypothetical protein
MHLAALVSPGHEVTGVHEQFRPYRGTPPYEELLREGRILTDRDWPHYDGYNVAFRLELMSPEELRLAHRGLWQRAFSPALTAHRLWRGARALSRGGPSCRRP